MRKARCETVRRELEELRLHDECSMDATQHLRGCRECREFYQQQTKLRQIVGSLGTVEAPPDFDFRLRARLANESSSAGFHFRALQWSFASKGFAAAAMILLFVGGFVYFQTFVDQRPVQQTIAEHRTEPPQPVSKPVENKVVDPQSTPVVASDNGPRRIESERRVTTKAKAPLVAADFASERPTMISDTHRHSPVFTIDASLEPFKVSLDDGHGNARTISVPTITFGSQRVLPAANQFAQKGDVVW